MTAEPLIPDRAQIRRVALVVTDLEEMVAFYRDVVGLTVRSQAKTTATLGTDEQPLLELRQDEDAPPRTREQAGLFHTAFKVPSRAALGGALERVRSEWDLDGASDHYVSEALYLTDPEKNGVEIYVDKPKDAWPRADDGSIQIGTIPLDIGVIGAQSDGSVAVPPETTVGHVHLEATSLQAAQSFYVETLGLTVQTAIRSAVFLAAGDYHHHLGVNTWTGRSQPTGGRGLSWFEIIVPDESIATVRQRLADTEDVVDHGEFLEISDPDGISIRIRTP
ncbi:VOC family protein [Natronolimnobius baerhuensis]|uniref:Glyoxalase n=1 Tax=Natronolimnobius baerhuensis TaxID=253108 RepID=A0A202E480_9EURY|nr:VOC family protein [Natronolimnobius baerhuensis]OVE82988.1 glyoxalase [Natronolimnobius baerhuensis]